MLATNSRSWAQATPPNEYQVKAAFLYNFAKFVEWPADTFADSSRPFSVCILGPDPFGHSLEDALLGKTIADRPVDLTRAKRIEDLLSCQILFVSGSETRRLPQILTKLRGRCVLLVGEGEDFAASGGAIQFTLEENHVRFSINPDAVERAGLKISSKLLALARIVRDAPSNGKS